MPLAFRKAVVDAGPLFTVLTLSFVRKYKREPILERAEMPRDSKTQDAYFQLFAGIQSVLTTSHVVGELQGLQSSRLRLKGMDFENFWLSTTDFLRTKNFDERLISLLEMRAEQRSSDRIGVFGPSDGGLIELAAREGCVFLTDDGALKGEAIRSGVNCHLVRDLLADPL